MMEWNARSNQGWETDTWHEGRHLKDWTDEETWGSLHGAFGRFDPRDSWSALDATIALFRRLAMDTAAKLGLPYPKSLDKDVGQFVRSLQEGDSFDR